MNISKTQFKKYTRCPRYYPLDQIHLKKLQSKVEYDEDILEVLRDMFDLNGEDFLKIDEKTLALLEYYKDVEREAIKQANLTFFEGFKYHEETSKQKKFSFVDESGINFYSYLDGYNENEKEALVIEVKATTTSKVRKIGFKEKNEFIPLFVLEEGVFRIRKDFENYQKLKPHYDKLFDRYSPLGKYIYDLAIERYIIEKSNQKEANKKYSYYLAILNNQYVFDGKYQNNKAVYEKINGEALICFIDLTDVTGQYLEYIEKNKELLVKYISDNRLDEAKASLSCRVLKNDQCEYFPICFKKLQENASILDIIGRKEFTDNDKNKYSLEKMINLGYYSLGDIPKEMLNDDNKLIQRECFEKNSTYVDRKKIEAGINEIKYPIYHLDFEGFPCPLPRYKGEAPYMQSLFQFSLHIEKTPGVCDFTNDCYSYLARDFSDCRKELIEEMIRLIDLTKGGSVMVYNKSYEATRIKELEQIFPQYALELKKIRESIFDLLDVIKGSKSFYSSLGFLEESKINYYHNNLHGSFSIKKVLPLFSDLSYKDLQIGNGNEAIIAYSQFKTLGIEEINELREELIKYCSQDTWSMVLVLDGLRKLIKKGEKI